MASATKKTSKKAITTQFRAKVVGVSCGSVKLVERLGWTEDWCTFRYTVDVDGYEDGTDDLAEARQMVAGRLRELRETRMEEITDAAREKVETLFDDGRVYEVLKALWDAGLI